MLSKSKKYFTFFGILAATVNRQLLSFNSSIDALISKNVPKINKILISKELKPIKTYTTINL
ncbi:MAG: hypothetical protein ACQERD_10990 [Campylobacterota bacterium]